MTRKYLFIIRLLFVNELRFVSRKTKKNIPLCFKSVIMEDTCKIINYSNVFLSCFSDNASTYTPMVKDHGLVYVLSGVLEINENGKITRLHKRNCAFIRKDNRVNMTKLPNGKEQYKSIWLTFTRKFLREFYRTLDKKQLPKDAERQKVSVYILYSVVN